MQASPIVWNPFRGETAFKLDQTGFDVGRSPMIAGRISYSDNALQPGGFQSVLMNTVGSLNATAQAPNALLQQSIATGDVDVHTVMLANAKADLAVNMAAQTTTKIIQAYDRILQIQI
ncbi:MAG: flagellar hook-basal body complex protein FliE [Candidatus Melainabacteria bacterium]|nr:flagellar hook-basal body complex protein FliE [Candidatus Melainabacteria bacterium]